MTLNWEQMVSTALLGTERRAMPSNVAPDHDDFFAGIEHTLRTSGRTAPEELLGLAAVMGTVRRAGRRSIARTPLEYRDDASSSDGPPVVASASQILDLLLTGTVAVARLNDMLLGRWVDACARTGQRIPNRLIVGLLERASQNAALRRSAARVVGERGRLVASLNPSWKWVHAELASFDGAVDNGEISADRLATAEPLGRVAMVESWRARDPDAAREAMLVGWALELAADRRDFTAALRIGLSPADEPMLERCLDDRGKSVRETAQLLLSQLPNSAFVGRMTARITPLISMKRFPRFALEVELPEETLDGAAVRDGLSISPQQPRADLLRQVVAAIPIRWWSQHCDRPLADLVDAVRKTDTANEVLNGLCESASRGSTQVALHPEDRAGLRQLWLDELGAFDAGQRKGTYDYGSLTRATTLQAALAIDRDVLIALCFDQDWTHHTIGQTLKQLIGESLVPTGTADRVIGWAKRNPGGLEALLVQPIELLLVSLSADVGTELARILPSDLSAHQRLRHLQAAASFIDAITKEFP